MVRLPLAVITQHFRFCATENYDDFWAINNKLMANARGELEPFKNIPFVLYEVICHHSVHGYAYIATYAPYYTEVYCCVLLNTI